MFCHFRNHWYVVEQISNYSHATVRLAEFKGARVCLVRVVGCEEDDEDQLSEARLPLVSP